MKVGVVRPFNEPRNVRLDEFPQRTLLPRVAASVGGLFHFKPCAQCQLLMLWTAPPPARECHECVGC
jgi:hypothetical protein